MQELESSPIGTQRILLTVVLSLLVLVAWGYIAPRPVPPPPEARPDATTAAAPLAATTPGAAPAPVVPAEAVAAPPAEIVQEASARRVVASTEAWSVELSNVGGRLTSWKLLGEGDYGAPSRPLELVRNRSFAPLPPPPEGSAAELPPVAAVSDQQDWLPLQIVSGDPALDRLLATALHVVTTEDLPGKRVLTARWSDGTGTSVEKILTLREDQPLATLEARLTVAGRPVPFHLAWGPGLCNHTAADHSNVYFRRGSLTYYAGDEVTQVERPDKQKALPETAVTWAGLQDSYFAVVFTPLAPRDVEPAGEGMATGFRLAGELKPGADGKVDKRLWPEELILQVPFSPEAPLQSIYAGPRDRATLRKVDGLFGRSPGLAMLTHLGMLDGIARVLHVPMVKFHAWTGSWGLAVVLLTLLVRVVIAPMQFFSMKKMRGMQDKMKPIQARVKALDERYNKLPPTRENKMKQMEEKNRLFMDAGINPADTMSGCLPLLITMPVFFALLKLLPAAPEFRHEAFLVWKDLAAADPTHVLPIAAAVLTLISTKMSMSSNSATIDPMQRNMLYLFPLMLIWLCWSAPLAFVVYQVAMSLVQIGQQQVFNMVLPPPDPAASPAPARAAKPSRDELTETAGAGGDGEEAKPVQARKKGRKR